MTTLQQAAASICAAGLVLHIFTAMIAALRCRRGPPEPRPNAADPSLPPVSILRPVRGIDQHDELTLRSGFALDYPHYELVFCCEDAADPAAQLITRLIDEHPNVPAGLLIGDDRSTVNPKLNNLIKGWHAARYDWIVLADCNVLMPGDYIQRLAAAWRPDTGLVCSPPVGCRPEGFWAEVECAFLNTYQARWQYAADSVGFGFAQGKSMLWRRETLACVGGIRALGAEIAEDAAATKVVRRQGLHVRLVDGPFEQPLGHRNWRQLWDRQVRWARLRRATFRLYFTPEILTTGLLPIASGAIAADGAGLNAAAAAVSLAVVWYGCEALLARLSGWHLSAQSALAWMCRDLLIPVFWVAAWTGSSFSWRGNEMRATRGVEADLDGAVMLRSKP